MSSIPAISRVRRRRLAASVRRGLRGAGGSGEEAQHKPVETPDSLQSIAYAKIVDLMSEGDIEGFVTVVRTGVQTDILKDVYLDETPVANADGSLNFQNVHIESRLGTQTQDYMPGFSDVENEIALNTVLTSASPFIRAVTDMTLDAVRVRLSVNALSSSDATTGDIKGYSINYAIDVSTDGGAYVQMINTWFTGKTGNVYERSHRIDLPKATVSGWNIKVRRITANAASIYIQDVTNVVSLTEIVDVKMRYPNSAVIGMQIDASQFQSIPRRSFHIKGRRIKVPANYDPLQRTYATTGTGTSGGAWDGTFKVAWSDNPAWIFYDLSTHTRYGLGHLVNATLIDKWALYGISQYCDEYVPTGVPKRATATTGSVTLSVNGTDNSYNRTTGSFLTNGFAVGDEIMATGFTGTNGGRSVITSVTALKMIVDEDHTLVTTTAASGKTLVTQAPTEPRMTCNLFLQQQGDAYKVLGDLASVFRGICYWNNGTIVPVADRPSDPVYTYTNANVEGGVFRYEGSAKKARHTVAIVSWSDPDDFGRAKTVYVEDEAGIARYGVQQMEIIGIGATSRSQAMRIGRWALYSERLDTNTCTWGVGIEGTYAVPGQIVRVADQAHAGRRVGGRVRAGATQTTFKVDAWPAVMPVAGDTVITTTLGGISIDRVVSSVNVGTFTVTVTVAFGSGNAPVEGSVWAVETSVLKLQNFRVLSVKDKSDGSGVVIMGLSHNESKFNAVDFGAPIETPTTSALVSGVQLAPSSVTVSSAERATTVLAALYVSATWPRPTGATRYEVQWQRGSGNWTAKEPAATNHATYHGVVFPDSYRCRVYAINARGVKSAGKTSAYLSVADQLKKPQGLADLATDVATATSQAAAANADIVSMTSDGRLSIVEKKRVMNDYTILINDQPGIDAQATAFGITTEKTAYDTALSALTTYLATLTSPVLWNNLTNYTTVVGTTFRSKFADAYNKEVLLLNKIYAAAKTLANTAQAAADAAQTTGNAAAADIANIASDNVLSIVEKKRVLNDWNAIAAEKAGISAQGVKYQLEDDLDNYNAAYTALQTYLSTLTSPVAWSNLTNYTTVVGATFRSKFADYYQDKVTLLQHIADVVMYGDDYTPSEILVPNPSFVWNRLAMATGGYKAINTALCDGWRVYNYNAYTQNSENGVLWNGTQIRCRVYGQTPIAAGTSRTAGFYSPTFPVQANKTYEIGMEVSNAFNGTLGPSVTARTRGAIHWYDSAGAQTGTWTVVADGVDRNSGTFKGTVKAPADARSARVDFAASTTNGGGTAYTHTSGSVLLDGGFNSVWVRKLEDLQIVGSGYQIGDQRNLTPTRTGSTGSRWINAGISFSIPTTGATAVVTFNVAAGTLKAGSAAIAYNASSGTANQTRSTTVTYYLYYLDNNYSGGAKTLNITTNAANISNDDDRIWIGDAVVTAPALGTGTSGSGGGGGSCVDGAMWIDERRQAQDIRPLDFVNIVDQRGRDPTPRMAHRRVTDTSIRIEDCWVIRTEAGAELRASASTPFTMQDGLSCKLISDMMGQCVLVNCWGHLRWEEVIECYAIGKRPVAHISVDNGSYFAGADPNNRIASHNSLKP